MIRKFLVEKRSWILFILFLQLFQLFMSIIDETISFYSMIYICFISILLFVIFCFIRYQKETTFYKSLSAREDDLDLTTLASAKTPFEKIIADSFTTQTSILKIERYQNLQQLELEKDELLSWIHEVKTPLTALRLLIDAIENQEMKTSLTFEWLRIHHLLDQQLYQKRFSFIQNDLYIENVDIEMILFEEIKTLQSWCMQKGIGFDIELQKKMILTDGKWLSFIIRQLLSNAVKYSNESDIIIRSYENDGYNCLEITDNGIGISPQDLPRIFAKGFTSTSKHQNNYATGMGLYLSKKIADVLKINIAVHSKLNRGTTFTLTFPKNNEFNQIHI
ncbi:sensor histidine kinase [Bacillus sp. PK3-056]|uniref:sensor histidine kinase n=1 Tax=Niallia circulans TaxID=1397 RepID=UPI000F453095|nr:sensor histidine kinase [Niallia circulans]AYV73674.1 histidine kinase [Niallia circulans]